MALGQILVERDSWRKVSRMVFSGSWLMIDAPRLREQILRLKAQPFAETIEIHLSSVDALDTTGAWMIGDLQRELQHNQSCELIIIAPLPSRFQTLYSKVNATKPQQQGEISTIGGASFTPIEKAGKVTVSAFVELHLIVSIIGAVIKALGAALTSPKSLRIPSIITQVERTGLTAVPIVGLMAFLIGAIVAQQSAFQLQNFGAQIFVVDLVGILVMREIGVLLTAVMVAGRSGSAYAAEIGAMKMREEVDAMRVIGIDYIQALIVPRVIGLLIALPLLTVLANVSAILGACLVANFYSGIPVDVFISRLHQAIGLNTVIVGILKAPFMAMIIAIISCTQGLRVLGSADSLGRNTTSAVVKSIFLVIVVDGIFAIIFGLLHV